MSLGQEMERMLVSILLGVCAFRSPEDEFYEHKQSYVMYYALVSRTNHQTPVNGTSRRKAGAIRLTLCTPFASGYINVSASGRPKLREKKVHSGSKRFKPPPCEFTHPQNPRAWCDDLEHLDSTYKQQCGFHHADYKILEHTPPVSDVPV